MQTSSFQPTHFTCLYATKSSNYFEMLTLLFVFVPPVSVLYLSEKKVSLNAEAGRGPGQLDPFSVHGNKNGTLLYIFKILPLFYLRLFLGNRVFLRHVFGNLLPEQNLKL